MDEKTAKLRDIFIDATGSDTVTESQEEGPGSLVDDGDDRRVTERVGELVSRMADRYEFESGLSDADLVQVVFGFYEGADDDDIAAELDADADAETVFRARMDLHLVGEADRDAPFELGELRSLVADGADDDDIAAELDADAETVARYRRVVEAAAEATRANHRFRDEFEELLTDADLSSRLDLDAHHDELREATEDIETNVSF
ncbi:conditioned medium-induced protein 4 [Halopelagius longus]|uniref:Conditioned medium-induced protein 4 n=1 Tax=Halopelagius longus TaxID=1236180 RepID=A0A370ILS4_9EURY|nr:conditioned medium-induced protein 4 [Halopelagius longus]RDI71649.1 conditioned medium-induced protein 4 [Halopelagius longus]